MSFPAPISCLVFHLSAIDMKLYSLSSKNMKLALQAKQPNTRTRSPSSSVNPLAAPICELPQNGHGLRSVIICATVFTEPITKIDISALLTVGDFDTHDKVMGA